MRLLAPRALPVLVLLTLLCGCWSEPTDVVAVRPSAPLLADDSEGAAVVREATFGEPLKASRPRFGSGAFLRLQSAPGCERCFIRATDVESSPLKGTPMWVAQASLELSRGGGLFLESLPFDTEVVALLEAPWLPADQAALLRDGRPFALVARAGLSPTRPDAESLLTHVYQALGALDFENARRWISIGVPLQGKQAPSAAGTPALDALRYWLDVHTENRRLLGPEGTPPPGGAGVPLLRSTEPPAGAGPAFVSTALATLHAGGSTGSAILGGLAAGTSVRVLSLKGAWAEVAVARDALVQPGSDVALDWNDLPGAKDAPPPEAGVADVEGVATGDAGEPDTASPPLAGTDLEAGVALEPQAPGPEEVTGFIERALLSSTPPDAAALASAARVAGVPHERAAALLATSWALSPADGALGKELLAHAVALREPRLTVETAAALRDLVGPAVTFDVQLLAGCQGDFRKARLVTGGAFAKESRTGALCVHQVELPRMPGSCWGEKAEREYAREVAAQERLLRRLKTPRLRLVIRNHRGAALAPPGGLYVARTPGPFHVIGGSVEWAVGPDSSGPAEELRLARIPLGPLRPSSTTVVWIALDTFAPQSFGVTMGDAPDAVRRLRTGQERLVRSVFSRESTAPTTWSEDVEGARWTVAMKQQQHQICGE